MAVVITVVLLVTLPLAVSTAMAQWTQDSDTASGLGKVGKNSVPAVFSMDGTWYLIAGEYDGVFNGYNWTGTEWQSDPAIISGLFDVGYCSAPAVFNKEGTWYLIAGEYDGVFNGYNWTGTDWQSDPAIVSGLGGIGRNSAPAVFNKDGTWYLIAGEKGGAFFGYHWNETGSTWEPDSGITAGLAYVGSYSVPAVFEMTLHLISGDSAGTFNGYKWTGTEWQVDEAIIEGLEDVGDSSAPAIFKKDETWYLISGNKAGTFNGYKFTVPTPPMRPEELFELLSGSWDFNGTMKIGEQTMPLTGTRTVILTGLASADFCAITRISGEEMVETGKAWWDAGMGKLAMIEEEEEEERYYDLMSDGWGATYELPEGIPGMGIFEPVFCEESEIFVDEDTLAHSWEARNATTGLVVASWEATFTRTNEWHVCEGISIQDAIDNANDGDTVIVHEGIYEEQLYIAKSLDLKAAEGESPEIRAPEVGELESYIRNISLLPGWTLTYLYTPIIMGEGSGNTTVNISGFIINGSSVTPETSEHGICGVVYYNAQGIIENNEIKNIWGLQVETEGQPLPWNGDSVNVISNSNVTIRRNSIHDYTGAEGAGIVIYDAKAVITENFVNSSVDSPDQCGIEVGCGATATVNDNIVTGNLYKEHWWYVPGILFWDANGSIQGNTLANNQVGISTKAGWLRASSSIYIKDNVVNASEAGVMIATYSPWGSYYEGKPSITATIEGNQLVGVSGSGIVIGDDNPEHNPLGTVNTKITRNLVSGLERGIELHKQSNSVIYLNDFVNNTQNVFVNESTNLYSSPEKIDYTYQGRDYTNYLGNYWSDYEGEDANANGIGDTPYNITGDNPDSYPLMHSQGDYEQIGILVMAHGSPRESWCKPIREAVENVSMGYPIEVGFLEFVDELEGYNFIHEAVDKLDEQGVTKIIAVPLFISSSSGHIAEIEYVLGLRETLPEMVAMAAGAMEEKKSRRECGKQNTGIC